MNRESSRDIHTAIYTYIYIYTAAVAARSLQSCPALGDPTDCSPPGSPIHGILQARTLEWVAMLSSRGPSGPSDGTWVSCPAGRFFAVWATRGAPCRHYHVRADSWCGAAVSHRGPARPRDDLGGWGWGTGRRRMCLMMSDLFHSAAETITTLQGNSPPIKR